MPSYLVDAAFIFSSVGLAYAAVRAAIAFAEWVQHEIHRHRP